MGTSKTSNAYNGKSAKKKASDDVRSKVLQLENLLNPSVIKQDGRNLPIPKVAPSSNIIAIKPPPSTTNTLKSRSSSAVAVSSGHHVSRAASEKKVEQPKKDVMDLDNDELSDDSEISVSISGNPSATSAALSFVYEIPKSISEQLKNPEVAKIPAISLKRGIALLSAENAELEVGDGRWQPYKRRPMDDEAGKTYIEPSGTLKLMKTSMRFVPGVNNAPNVNGNPDDPPYLLKAPGLRPISKQKVQHQRIATIAEEFEYDQYGDPADGQAAAFDLTWPKGAGTSQVVEKTHQNMLVALTNYHARKAAGPGLPYDPSLSISCAIAAGRAPFPKFLQDGMRLAMEAGAPYVPIPHPDADGRSTKKANEENGPTGPERSTSEHDHTDAPVFPDLDQNNLEGVPSNAKLGYVGASGIFHEANAGDRMPETGGKIGYMDEDGVYHEVSNVFDGLKNGQLQPNGKKQTDRNGTGTVGKNHESKLGEVPSVRMSASVGVREKQSTASIGFKKPEGSVPSVRMSVSVGVREKQSTATIGFKGATRTEASASEGAINANQILPGAELGYLDKDGKFHKLEAGQNAPSGTQVGYLDSDGKFVPVSKVEIRPSQIPAGRPEGPLGSYDKEGKFHKFEPGQGPTGPTRLSQLPLGTQLGYLDKDGKLQNLRPGETPPPGTQAGYLDKNDKFVPIVGDTVRPSQAPITAQLGYLDKGGKFHKVEFGQKVPPGIQVGYLDSDGKFVPVIDDTNTGGQLPPDAQIGYVDKDGKFHKMESSQAAPPGTQAGYLDKGKNGKFVPITGDAIRPSQIAPGTQMGYLDKDGKFHKLEAGQKPPPGTRAGYLDNDGKFVPIVMDAVRPSQIPVGVELGYFDKDSKFHKLEPGQKAPTGMQAGYLEKDGTFVPIMDHESANASPNPIPAGAQWGYTDKDGNSHKLEAGQKAPPGTQAGYLDRNGKFVPANQIRLSQMPSASQLGYLDKNGKFQKLEAGQKAPPGGAQTGYLDNKGNFVPVHIDSDSDSTRPSQAKQPGQSGAQFGYKDKGGKFQKLESSEKAPAGAETGYLVSEGNFIPAKDERSPSTLSPTPPDGSQFGYMDKDGKFHRLAPGQKAPPGMQAGYLDKNGKFVPSSASSEGGSRSEAQYGYYDKDGKFHKLAPGQKAPPGMQAGYLDSNGKFVSVNEVPPGAQLGYMDKDGKFHALRPGEKAPPGTQVGYLDKDGKFVPAAGDGNAGQSGEPGPQFGYYDKDGKFNRLEPGQKAPPGMQAGYLDSNGKFVPVEVNEEGRRPSQVPPGTEVGYLDKDGKFHKLNPGEKVPSGAGAQLGYFDSNGKFVPIIEDGKRVSQIPIGSELGYYDKDGNFHRLKPGQEGPPGTELGYIDGKGIVAPVIEVATRPSQIPPQAQLGYFTKDEKFHELKRGQEAPSDTQTGYLDNEGEFVPIISDVGDATATRRSQAPPETQLGYVDKDGKFHKLEPGQKPPAAAKVGYFDKNGKSQSRQGSAENPDDIVEVEIHDESDLDENGKPKVKVEIRHRTSVEAPKDAKPVEGGGLTWVEGNEVVTELPYADEKDLDANGKPKMKKMRVRKPLYSEIAPSAKSSKAGAGSGSGPGQKPLGRQRGSRGPPKPGDVDYAGSEEVLRDAPLTEEELKELEEFQRNVSVQVDLEYVEGSLDLGDVVRKSFRIYTNGASIDIDPSRSRQRQSVAEAEAAEKNSEQNPPVVSQ